MTATSRARRLAAPADIDTAAPAAIEMASYGQAVRHLPQAVQASASTIGDERIQLRVALAQDRRALGHGGQAGGHALGRALRSLAGAGDEDAVDDGLDRAQLGVDLVEEAVAAQGQLERPDQLLVLPGDHARDEDQEVGRDGQLLAARQEVADGDDQAGRPCPPPPRAARRPGTGGRRSRPCATRCRASRTCRTSACRGRGGTGGPSRRGATPGSRRGRRPCSSSGSSTRWPRSRPPAGGCPRSRRRRCCGRVARRYVSGPVAPSSSSLYSGSVSTPSMP